MYPEKIPLDKELNGHLEICVVLITAMVAHRLLRLSFAFVCIYTQ